MEEHSQSLKLSFPPTVRIKQNTNEPKHYPNCELFGPPTKWCFTLLLFVPFKKSPLNLLHPHSPVIRSNTPNDPQNGPKWTNTYYNTEWRLFQEFKRGHRVSSRSLCKRYGAAVILTVMYGWRWVIVLLDLAQSFGAICTRYCCRMFYHNNLNECVM